MKNSKRISAILLSVFFGLTIGSNVFAGLNDSTSETSQAQVADENKQEDYDANAGGQHIGNNSSNTIAYSRNVAGIEVTREQLMSDTALQSIVFDRPTTTTGSVTLPATSITQTHIESLPAGTNVWIEFTYAENAGWVTDTNPVTGESVKRWVEPGDIIGVVGLNDGSWGYQGQKAADAVAKVADYLAKTGVDMNGVSVKSVAEMLSDYNMLLATGVLTQDLLDENAFLFTDRIGKELEKLTEAEKEELKELIEELLKQPPVPPSSNPDCHDANHWGDTIGKVSVQNINTNTGWREGGTVWARPGDTIQFKIYYCWGAQAVGADDYNPARTQHWTGQDSQYFQLSATQNDNYLFGENAQYIGPSKHVLNQPHNATIGPATGGAVPNDKVDYTSSYEFTLYSPGQKDGSNYNCMIFDFSPYFLGFGYQIPGVDTGGCAAISQTGNMSDVSNSPGVISQTIEYDRIQAWQLYKYQRSGSCAGCNYNDIGQIIDHRSYNDRNSLTRQNIRVMGNPFASLNEAKTAGGNMWGIVMKHQNSTAQFKNDCDVRSCGCNSWHHWVVDGCSDCRWGQWHTIYDEYGSHEEWWCDGGYYSYSCYQSCGYNDRGAVCNNRPGQSFYESESRTYTERGNIHPINLGHQSQTASVNVPYSYRTRADSYINEGEVIYLGQSVTSTFSVNILPRVVTEVRSNEAYATLVDGFIQAVEFIADDVPGGGGVAPVDVPGNDLCNYFGGDCREIWREGPKLNKEGRYKGENYSHAETRAVPDDRDDLVGKKYCVAVGISTADSHGIVDAEVVSGMSNPSAWRISGVSCRTIAKKPNFQVWNGGLYTNGYIETSASYKNVGVSLGGSTEPTGAFGSWEEYYVVAAKDVRTFASGAALGYYPSLRPRGGKDPASISTYCDVTKKTIANDGCAGNITGRSGVTNTSQQIILERIYSRYALEGDNTSYVGRKLDNSARYIYKKTDDIRISDIVNAFHSTEMYNADRTTYNCNYGTSSLKMCQGQSANAEQTTSNYADGTLVIHTGGKVIIDRNICYGNGACNNSSDVRLNNNSEYFTSMYGLPQVVIIADKGIDITSGATHVDAWLVTNGTINTCTDFSMGSPESACNSTLIVNGPVFADGIRLNRAGGAYPGAGSGSTVLDTNLSRTGSITPGEIFNLRPDTLYWAYSQAQRFTQATATYTRELAPRY